MFVFSGPEILILIYVCFVYIKLHTLSVNFLAFIYRIQ